VGVASFSAKLWLLAIGYNHSKELIFVVDILNKSISFLGMKTEGFQTVSEVPDAAAPIARNTYCSVMEVFLLIPMQQTFAHQ
jgi:hypothetical protein